MRRSRSNPTTRALILAVTTCLVLAGCGGGSQAVTPGPDAGTAACTALVARLPDSVFGRSRVTDFHVAGAAAWGDPAIVLRCGVPRTGPTASGCQEINGVDWTYTQTKDAVRFLTFGRTPEIEVTVPIAIGTSNAPSTLVDLAAAVKPIPVTDPCN